jgi:hypothetical protein
MKSNGYPRPPRSACIYCPFHSDSEWRRLKTEEPEEFARVVAFEADLQDVKLRTDKMKGKPFLHPSLKPIGEVDFRHDSEWGQKSFWPDEQSFGNECEGMCGI